MFGDTDVSSVSSLYRVSRTRTLFITLSIFSTIFSSTCRIFLMKSSVLSKWLFEICLIAVMLLSMCCSSMRLSILLSAAIPGYLNLTLKFCGAADPQLKKLGNVVSSSQFQSQSLAKSESFGGGGTVCK